MLPNFYFVEKKLNLKRELCLFKDINGLYNALHIKDPENVVDFEIFKQTFVDKKLNTIHFSLSKAECPIEFSDLAARIIVNSYIQRNTAAAISFGVYFLYFFYALSPLKKRVKFPLFPEVFEALMDERCVSDDTYAFVLNKMIKEGMFTFGIKMPPLDKPFDLNKKDILKKAEYQLEDLKHQYSGLLNDEELKKIGTEAAIGDEVNVDALKKVIGMK